MPSGRSSVHKDKFNIITCNPPYISNYEYYHTDRVSKSVKLYEPKIALTSPSSGLNFYKRLSYDLSKVLYINNSKVILEIGNKQKDDVMEIFDKTNQFKGLPSIYLLFGFDLYLIWLRFVSYLTSICLY